MRNYRVGCVANRKHSGVIANSKDACRVSNEIVTQYPDDCAREDRDNRVAEEAGYRCYALFLNPGSGLCDHFQRGDSPTMIRTASAHWAGSVKEGKGTVSTASGILKDTQYSFATRFADGAGTNPEELIAAAHAGCFSMALSGMLGAAGLTPDSIDTKASLTLEKGDAGFSITNIHLDVTAKVPGTDAAKFGEVAENARKGCIISRALNTNITMTAKLVA
jgi:osmotically inducible protein OsmC